MDNEMSSMPLDFRNFVLSPPTVEWRYEMRRQSQEIIPSLFLGPFQASKSIETLQNLNISHILCIRDADEAFSVKPRFPERFKYLVLDVRDREEQNIIKIFSIAKDFIDDALQSQGRILVHCNGGISLSPTIVVMYVMQHYQMTWEDALQAVQNRRYCISPNAGFLAQIKEYESIYRANRTLASHPSSEPVSRRKRGQDDTDEDESREEDRKRLTFDSHTTFQNLQSLNVDMQNVMET